MKRSHQPPFGIALRAGVALGSALLLLACDNGTQATAPTAEVNDAALEEILLEAIQDEYHAEAVYQGVLNDFGQVYPFANILTAEVRHSTAIGRLYENRGWAVPASAWNADNAPHFAGVPEACAVGADAEIANVAVYDDLLASGELPADVVQVFTSNRSASLERHLPAFETCKEPGR